MGRRQDREVLGALGGHRKHKGELEAVGGLQGSKGGAGSARWAVVKAGRLWELSVGRRQVREE
jgi:hypothetical protein